MPRFARLLLLLVVVLPLVRQLVDVFQRPRRQAGRHGDVELLGEGLHHLLGVGGERETVVLHDAPDVVQLGLDVVQAQLLADQLLLGAKLGLLRGRELLVEGADELADAGIDELGGNDGVDVHAGGREAKRNVGDGVAKRGGGVVRQRLRGVHQKAVRGVLGGGKTAERAAVDENAELLGVAGVLQGLDAKQLLHAGLGVGNGDLLDGDAVEETAVVRENHLQFGLEVRGERRKDGALSAGLLDDGGETTKGERKVETNGSERRLRIIASLSERNLILSKHTQPWGNKGDSSTQKSISME